MGQSVSLFLVRAAGLVCAGMLLFAVFAGARAASYDNYGLNRFPGDNYDTVPPGASYPPAPEPPGYTPAPAGPVSLAPAPAASGYYPTLNGSVMPQQTYQPAPVAAEAYGYRPSSAPPPQQTYQPAPVAAEAYGYRPSSAPPPQQAYQPAPVSAQPYGYKPLPASAATAYPQRMATASLITNPYAYYDAPGQPGQLRGNPDYVLGTGDKLHLIVFGEADLSGDFTVDGSGNVQLPLIGPVRAAGYTAPQLEAVIGGALSRGYLKSPRVAVQVATNRPFYIIGAVNRPGQYAYVDHMNALNAVALAGGFSPSAVESVVFVRREGSNREVEVPADRSTVIYPGDVVNVHNTFFSDLTNWLSPFSGVAASAATAAVIQ